MTRKEKINELKSISASLKEDLRKSEDSSRFLGLNCFSELNTNLSTRIQELDLAISYFESEDHD